MNKKEFLGASLHTGLKFKHRIALGYNYSDPKKTTIDYDYAIDEMHGVNLNKVLYGSCYGAEFDNVELILRPLSDLTKPITQNGETFVPIVELSKIGDTTYDKLIISNLKFDYRFVNLDYLPVWMYRKLIEWHFNLMDELEPFIPVTSEFNPYK